MLCIDSVHEGKRGLYVIPVDEEALAHPVAVKAGRRSLKGMLKRNKVLYHVTRTLKKAPEPFYKLYMLWCHRRYGVQPNTAFFTSYDGTLYNDNPRAVAEALHALSPDTRIQAAARLAGAPAAHVPADPAGAGHREGHRHQLGHAELDGQV